MSDIWNVKRTACATPATISNPLWGGNYRGAATDFLKASASAFGIAS
jgi:hypothetical protein